MKSTQVSRKLGGVMSKCHLRKKVNLITIFSFLIGETPLLEVVCSCGVPVTFFLIENQEFCVEFQKITF